MQTSVRNFGQFDPKTYTVYRGDGANNPAHNFNSYGKGKHYTFDPSFAALFGTVTKQELRLNNPLILRSQFDLDKWVRLQIQAGFNDLTSYARSRGYDGLIDYAVGTVIKFF